MDTFFAIEDKVKLYFYQKRKNQLDESDIELLNEYYNEANNAENIF